MSCARELRQLREEASSAPPNQYRSGYLDALFELEDRLEELECECNEEEES